MPPSISSSSKPVHKWSYTYLLVPPVLMAIATALVLWERSDLELALLYSQCHSRALLPFLSHIPVLGAPSCFLVAFFQAALNSVRAFATMSVVLSFFAGLLTVSTVEAARICNRPNVLIAYPTGPWLVFNLIGGALVWQLVIIPAFFHRSKELLRLREQGRDGEVDEADLVLGGSSRHLSKLAEVVAIPVSVAIGFVAPSVVMAVTNHPIAIAVWLFFPIYVSVIRQSIRWAVLRFTTGGHDQSCHLESHRPSLVAMYAVPIACSVLVHGLLIWSLTQKDDRRKLTRSAINFIGVDAAFILLTVLYWVFVEAGWRVMLVMAAVSVILGPGAGVSLGWIYRERHLHDGEDDTPGVDEEGQGEAGEETPLLA